MPEQNYKKNGNILKSKVKIAFFNLGILDQNRI